MPQRLLGFGTCLVALVATISPFALAQTTVPAESGAARRPAAVVVIEGQIDDLERDALARRFAQARAVGAKTVIVEIDTYGGLVSSAMDMSRFLKQQTDLHTIALVRNKAYSAGAMIALACDELAMQPNSAIGDCAPIAYTDDGRLQSLGEAERAKAESPVLADFLDSARRNGYAPLVAEAMVVTDRVVHYLQSATGERRFTDSVAYERLMKEGWTPVSGVPDPIDRRDHLLTLHSELATKIGLSGGEYSSAQALAEARGLALLGRFEAGAGDALLEVLNSALARLLMIMLFVISLKIAISTPGHGLPEAIAVIALGLLVGVPLLTGYAQLWEIALIFLGLALVAFEIFVFPGHLVSAIVGVLMIIAGLVMTFVGREPGGPGVLPNLPMTWVAIERGLLIVVGGLVCSLLLSAWLNRYLPKLPYVRHLVLSPDAAAAGATAAIASPLLGATEAPWPAVGATGRAVTDLKPGGSAEFHDELMNERRAVSVVSDAGFLPAGTELVVAESRGAFVVVRQV